MRATCSGVMNFGPPSAAAPSQIVAAFSAINIADRTASMERPRVMMPWFSIRMTRGGAAEVADKFLRVRADGLRQLQAGVGVGDEHRRHVAADDFIGKNPLCGELRCARRAKDGIDRRRVGVADKFNPRQREQPGVEQRLDRRLLRLGDPPANRAASPSTSASVRLFFSSSGRMALGAALDDAGLVERAEAGAAGFDEEGFVAQLAEVLPSPRIASGWMGSASRWERSRSSFNFSRRPDADAAEEVGPFALHARQFKKTAPECKPIRACSHTNRCAACR